MTKDAKPLAKGDPVSWNTPQGRTSGTVVRKVTGEAHVRGHVAKATPDAPEYEVRSDKSGATAIHRGSALRRRAKG